METSVNNKCMAFTSLEQSKKLAEILPLESADMYYLAKPDDTNSNMVVSDICIPRKSENDGQAFGELCAWSLAALLSIIRRTIGYAIYGANDNLYMSCDLGGKPWKLETKVYDNEVDACVAMVEKLHELKML